MKDTTVVDCKPTKQIPEILVLGQSLAGLEGPNSNQKHILQYTAVFLPGINLFLARSFEALSSRKTEFSKIGLMTLFQLNDTNAVQK